MAHSKPLQHFFSDPFNPLITFNPNETKISFYTQSFANLTGFHSSTYYIPLSIIDQLSYPLNEAILDNNYKIFQWRKYNDLYELQQQKWISECVHELRTSSMLLDLGIDVLSQNSENKTDIINKMKKASHRQKVSTLIASDFLQLIHKSLDIEQVPLSQIIKDSILLLKEFYQVQINSSLVSISPSAFTLNPFIFTDQHFFKNFLNTLFFWLEKIPIRIDIEIVNPVSVVVCINTPSEILLSSLSGFSLVMNYIRFIAAYFNGRAWGTQNSINMVFQLVK